MASREVTVSQLLMTESGMSMQNDTEHHLHEVGYTAYVHHLKNCAQYGPARCPVGNALCTDYLTRVRTMTPDPDAGPSSSPRKAYVSHTK